jgi:prevent-host-death family protein
MDVGVRELRQNLSVYLERIKLGETLRITERGQPVALLTPLDGEMSRVDALVAAGLARPAERSLASVLASLSPAEPTGAETSLSDALDLEREERLP